MSYNKNIMSKDNILDEKLEIDDLFRVLDLYFERKGIIFQHLFNSYNKFLFEDIKLYLDTGNHVFFEKIIGDKIIKYKFIYENISIKPPTMERENELMFPCHARDGNLTYSCKLMATVKQIQEIRDINTNEVQTKMIGNLENNVPIAIIPVMVKSDCCNIIKYKQYEKCESEYDPGGYFIIKGSEKVIISQDRICDNKPLVFSKKEAGIKTFYVQIHSRSYDLHNTTQIMTIKLKKDGNIILSIPLFNEISIFILLRALGIESDKDIINCITLGNNNDYEINDVIEKGLKFCVDKNNKKIQTSQDAINYLTTKLRLLKKYNDTDKETKLIQKKIHLMDLLKNNLLPHINNEYFNKAIFIGYMISRLIKVSLKKEAIDDRDSYLNKRIELPGELLFELFKQFYKKMLNECNKHYKAKNPDDAIELNIINQIKPGTIEQGINSALLTGTWPRRKGIAQVLSRISYLNTLSLLSRIDAQGGDPSAGTATGQRQLHPSSIRGCCVIQTPEHAKVGLTKHKTLIGSITINKTGYAQIIKDFLKGKYINLQDIPIKKFKNYTKIFLNGEWIGLTENQKDLYNEIKKNKLDGTFISTVSVVHDIEKKEIKIYCDGGRLYCPSIVVEDNLLKLSRKMIEEISLDKKDGKINTWDEFVIRYPGVIENIDVEEQASALMAFNIKKVYDERKKMIESIDKIYDDSKNNRYDEKMFVKYSNCEIHPSLLLAEIVANIPFCNHTPGTRNIFQYNQGRQAMGIYISNYRERLDISYILYHSQKRLVSTRASKYISSDIMTAGENVIVAVLCYSGYNQEDSLIFNQGAIDRGLFRSMTLDKKISQIQKNQSSSHDDMFAKPDKTTVSGMKNVNYDKLNIRGFVPEETTINNGDVIIGKISPVQMHNEKDKPFRDNSLIYKSIVPAVIDKVYTNIFNNEGYEIRKIRTRSERTPIIGDKFCCYTADHDILTTDGWVPINQITLQHRVACLDEGKYLRYVNPYKIQSYDYDGDLYVVDSKQVNLKVTMNHRMYVAGDRNKKYKIELAEKIYGKRRKYLKNVEKYMPSMNEMTNDLDYNIYIKDKAFQSNEPQYFIIDNKFGKMKLDIEPWLTFFGIWIAEGCISRNIDKIMSLQITADKLRVKLALIDCCNKLNFNIRKHTKGTIKNELEQCCQDLGFDIYKQNSSENEETDIRYVFDKCYDFLNIVKSESYAFIRKKIIDYDNRSQIINIIQTHCKTLGYDIYVYPIKNILEKCYNNYGLEIFKSTLHIKKTDIKNILEEVCQDLKIDYEIDVNEKKHNIKLYFKIINYQKRENVEQILKKIGEKYHYYVNEYLNDHKRRNSWCITNKVLSKYFDHLSLCAVNKYLPKWVWSLTTMQCNMLINGMLLGDGHTNRNTYVYDTASTQLADDFQRLCLHAGHSANKVVKEVKGHESKMKNGTIVRASVDNYRLHITQAQNNPLVNKNIKRNGEGRVDGKEYFKGKVYCCSVLIGEGILYVRRKGVVVWSGNSAYGCKGVIGLTMNQVDMPFTKNGLIPDIILNPCALPSRMSVGQIMEILVAKRGALYGTEIDGTPFNDIDLENEKDLIEQKGFNRSGYEYLYNGETGQKMKAMICIGPNYYQRLKHLVEDKVHARARGPLNILNRQPPEGRSKEGGLKLGEMERDAIAAYGIALFLKEKFVDSSDIYKTRVCDQCGLFAQRVLKIVNKKVKVAIDNYYCPACNNYTDISEIVIPYAFKLLVQELMAMNIAPRIRTKKTLF